jgi:hypothetical protein
MQVARVKRLEKAYGNLDEYGHDGLVRLRESLAYSRQDESAGKPNPAAFEINGSFYKGLSSYRSTINYYRRFLQESSAGDEKLSVQALQLLKERFLRKFPDFEESGGFPGRSSYHPDEDDYKRAMLAELQPLRGSGIDPTTFGAQVLDTLTGKQSNLLGHFSTTLHLREIRQNHPGVLERATGLLANSMEPPAEAAETFLRDAWPLLVEGREADRPFGESRILATAVQALTRPTEAISVIYQRFYNLGLALLGQSLFGNNPLTAEEYARILALAGDMFVIMRDEWGWQPRDLWDVQGFVWVTCGAKLSAESPAGEQSLTDAQILAHFDRSALFRVGRAEWAPAETAAFCAIARAVHHAGLDWWFVDIARSPVRFGRKSAGRKHAEGVMGYLSVSPPWVSFNDRGLDGLDLEGFAIDPDKGDMLARALADKATLIAGWKAPQPTRSGLWPDESEREDSDEQETTTMLTPTNLILYGPPGTGKTYTTMERAVALCGELPADDRTALREQYDRLRAAGQIEFVTFHQNFAYEEFVEGLRPVTGAEGTIGLQLEAQGGIFRTMATTAEEARKSAQQGAAMELGDRRVFKMSLGRSGIDDDSFEDAWDGGFIALGYGGEIDWSDYRDYEAIRERWNRDNPGTHGSSGHIAQVNRFVADMKPGDLVVVPFGNMKIRAIGEVTGPYEFVRSEEHEYHHRRAVRWLKRFDEPLDYSVVSEIPFTQRSCYPIRSENLKPAGLASLLPGEGGGVQAPQQFVLIIDEINRANISRVFGELITLIEPDKRLGMANALTVRLPYSRREFGVPANLHIVGTMNTADRSIALLDTALRRRFRFEELAPRPDLLVEVEGVPLGPVLDTINRRLEYLLDRDHAIGHAFFMGEGGASRAAIDDTMRFKIIPLLQEYFFEDWGRIHAVLGEGFITGTRLTPPPGFEDDRERRSWSVRRDFLPDAYATLLAGKPSQQDALSDQEDEGEGS